jgi:hypothetical protein
VADAKWLASRLARPTNVGCGSLLLVRMEIARSTCEYLSSVATHLAHRCQIGRTDVVSNPFGYPHEKRAAAEYPCAVFEL